MRRILDEQHALALGAPSMAHVTLVELARDADPSLIDFLTPLCKVYCTEAGNRSANLGVQILGGHGDLTEYRIEQT